MGTALFNNEYAETLLQNIRLVSQNPLHRIEESGVEDYLPEPLRERLTRQREAIGEEAYRALFTSGIGISKIGTVVRKVLGDKGLPLPMQRDKDSRPRIERDIDFPHRHSPSPESPAVSRTTIGYTIAGRAMDDLDEAGLKHVKTRDIPGVGGSLFELGTSGLVSLAPKIGVSAARIAFLTLEGTVAALSGFVEDRKTRKIQEKRGGPSPNKMQPPIKRQ